MFLFRRIRNWYRRVLSWPLRVVYTLIKTRRFTLNPPTTPDQLLKNSPRPLDTMKQLSYPPFPNGILVYHFKDLTRNNPGKILSCLGVDPGYDDYIYLVSYAKTGSTHTTHAEIVPSKDFFQYIPPQYLYESTLHEPPLIYTGQILAKIGDYLHNDSSTLILSFEKYKQHFKPIKK